MTHTIYHGDKYVSAAVKIGDRQLKVKLYTQRAAAHFEIGRYRSAANDYGRVLASATNKRVQASTLGGDRKEVRCSVTFLPPRVVFFDSPTTPQSTSSLNNEPIVFKYLRCNIEQVCVFLCMKKKWLVFRHQRKTTCYDLPFCYLFLGVTTTDGIMTTACGHHAA